MGRWGPTEGLALCGFYRSVRTQYSLIYSSAYYVAKVKKMFMRKISPSEVFYCIIEKNDTSIGYVAIKEKSPQLSLK